MVTERCGGGAVSLLTCPYRMRAAPDRGRGARQVLSSAQDKLWQVIILIIIWIWIVSDLASFRESRFLQKTVGHFHYIDDLVTIPNSSELSRH